MDLFPLVGAREIIRHPFRPTIEYEHFLTLILFVYHLLAIAHQDQLLDLIPVIRGLIPGAMAMVIGLPRDST